MNDSFKKAEEIINTYFGTVSYENKKIAMIESSWRDIIMQIRKNHNDSERMDISSQLADHSRIKDYNNNTLFIETDHPTRLQLFYLYKNTILNLLNKKYPDLKIERISFFIGKQKKEEKNTLRDVTAEEIDKAIEKRTGNYEGKYEYTEKKVPDEIKKMFEVFFK
ncbi:MAG: DUF721 domain-containing protein [Treponemataceae bacterium]|nr:DUF721 domain-containing protein [Treponemataceae bacterium]